MNTFAMNPFAMNKRARGFVVVLTLLLQGCSTPAAKPESAVAPGTDIPAYTTFSLRPAGNAATAPTVSILDTNILAAIRTQLTQKGYKEVSEKPDFVVAFDIEPYQVEKKSSSPFNIGIGVGSWGGNVGGGVGTSVDVGGGKTSESSMNRLTIRAADPATSKELWVGTTAADIKQGLDAAAVDKAVAGTMAGFPVRRSN